MKHPNRDRHLTYRSLLRFCSKLNERFKLIALVLICGTNIFAQPDNRTKIDSLERLVEKKNLSDKELLKIYYELSGFKNYYPTKAAYYAKQGISLSEKTGDMKMLFNYNYSLSSIYYNLSEYDSSLVLSKKVIELYPLAEKETRDNVLGFTYNLTGNIYTIRGRFEEALENLFHALKIAEEIDNKRLLLYTYSSMAYTYVSMQNFDQAENYYVKMKNTCIEVGDKSNTTYALYQLSNIYIKKNEYNKALLSAKEAHNLVRSIPDVSPNYLIQSFSNLSSAWRYFNTDKALEYINEALELTEKHNIFLHKAFLLSELASLYYERGDAVAAEHTALQALELEELDIQSILYEIIIQANIKLGNKEKATEYFNLYRDWVSDYSNSLFQESLSEMEVKYEVEKKELHIAALEQEKRLMTLLSIAGATVLLLALTTLFLLWHSTVQKRRLSEQQIKQLQQEKQLVATQALLDGETQERHRLARDLHDGLGSILAAAKYNLADIKNTPAFKLINIELLDKALTLLDESMTEMRRVAHHLMPESLSRYGLKQSVTDFCKAIPHAKFAYYGDETRLDSKMNVMVYRIMHELVSNALRHSGASQIQVQIVQEPDRISLTVQDDGCGFDTSAESKGTGLTNIRNRIAAHNGNLLIDSVAGMGTEVGVELRVNS